MEVVGFVVDQLHRIPDVVWSGIMASVITLTGVMLSNRANDRRQRFQLQHDSEERARERRAELRREVYLRASEEMIKASRHLAALPQLDPSKQNVTDGFAGLFEAGSKVALISDDETSALVGELMTRYSELTVKMIGKAQPISQLQSEADIAGSYFEREQSEVQRISGALTRLKEAPPPLDQPAYKALEVSLREHHERAMQYGGERIAAMRKRNALHKSFVLELLAEMRPILDAQLPVTVALRRELLDVRTNLDVFRAQQEANTERIIGALSNVMTQMEQQAELK